MAVLVTRDTTRDLGFDLAEAVAAHASALKAHADTEGEPAPVAHPLVEYIIAQGGDFEIIDPPHVPTPAEIAALAMSSAGGRP